MMSGEPRDQREVQAAIELRTPPWLPGVSANFSFKRMYERRAVEFFQSVADRIDATPEELAERVAAGDKEADLINVALSRVAQRGDGQYIDVLTALVAAALTDDAKFDESAYLIDRIVRLEPIHIRITAALREEAIAPEFDVVELAGRIEISIGILESCLGELASVGFVAWATVEGGMYKVTNLGGLAIEEVYKILANLQDD
jgi:hypothetical protein